jgi:hypothetical protein
MTQTEESVMTHARDIGLATLQRLAQQAAVNRAAGDALRAEVRTVLERNPGRLTAKQVIKGLMRDPLPSVRRVQEVMRELRLGSSNA